MVASIQVTVPATGNRISIPSGLFINNQFVPSQETITIVHRSADLLLNYLMCVPDCTSFLGRFCKAAAREAFKTSLTLIPGLVLPLARTHSLGNNFYTSLNLSFDYPHHKAWRRTMFIVSHDASVEGFGEWRILISTRADRNIREAKKKDSKLFRIIMKKIRELSNGHFSDDNQKRYRHSNLRSEDDAGHTFGPACLARAREIHHVLSAPSNKPVPGILADQDVAHVFHLSPAEQEIVKHSGSCYVLGRSGTGWDLMNDSLEEKIPRPRQVFVTQSRVLAEKVEEYYAKLSKSCAAAQRTAEDSTKMASKSTFHCSSHLINFADYLRPIYSQPGFTPSHELWVV
ncbi:hypothetical protein EW026_g7617 [Hermanssonia centrifuga]|uniref:Uncharacterized protein n=1 Tax=Hermanssonia centrifuga TaxID=98765 RepID=A0A4S4K785_9APHY|nr:hypothetical protein EW026_g7617 [Hermanssonia centrifuga]